MSGADDQMSPEEIGAMVSEFGMMPVPEDAVAIVSFTPVLVDGQVNLSCGVSHRPYVRMSALAGALRRLADSLAADEGAGLGD